MTAEQILDIDPDRIGYYIQSEVDFYNIPKSVNLEKWKKSEALKLILDMKRKLEKFNKKYPITYEAAKGKLTEYKKAAYDRLVNPPSLPNIKTEVDSIIDQKFAEKKAQTVIQTNKALQEQIAQKDLQNRIRALGNEPPIPYTGEEALYKRVLELRKGGKRTRKYRKGSKRRFNKKLSKKNKKRSTNKRKY
jgi:hypothetical protein